MNNINVYLNTLRQKGYLAYEYNPFHNYQTNVNIYKCGNYLIPEGCAINTKNGMLLHMKNNKWVDDLNNIISNENVLTWDSSGTSPLYVKGSLIDLDTDKLNFDLNHPVDITIQPSYDGSVNLILNDGKNIPRLINSRFSAREKGTYEIVDRIGENDTNIYGSETFDKDTSLYFLYEKNPLIDFKGLFEGGNLPVGAYCYYFTYCDADDNESDIVAETGIIHVFLGSNGYPGSVEGGIKNINSHKQITLQLSNVDKSYNYFKIYQVRYLADYGLNKTFECKKFSRKYPIKSSKVTIQINGNEETEDIDANLLNLSLFNPKDILTLAQCKNMLFFGNIHKNTDNYKELQDCALRIIPKLEISSIKNIDNDYKINGTTSAYYNATNMYNNTGYFNREYYRFGVVFIYKNGGLSNVYNTLGGVIRNNEINYIGLLYENNNSPILTRKYIQIDDSGWIKNAPDFFSGELLNINSKGVCKIDYLYENSPQSTSPYNDDTIIGITFNIPLEVLKFLKEDLGIRGMFFVRLKRIANLLAQCYLLPFDETLEAPVLEIKKNNSTNYYSECFLTQPVTEKFQFDFMGRKITKLVVVGDRVISNDYERRLYKYKNGESNISKNAYVAVCPDFLLNQPYYSQIFNNSKFDIEQITEKGLLEAKGKPRMFTEGSEVTYILPSNYKLKEVTACAVTEEVPTVALEDVVFKLEKGKADEVYRFKYAEIDKSTYRAGDNNFDSVNKATNLVRGMYSPYVAIYSTTKLKTGELYNIYAKGSVGNENLNFLERMNNSDAFYAISDRYNFEDLKKESNTKYYQTCWRGDCYLNTFTYRLNRNFNDKALPNNDEIINENTWKDNYDAGDSSKWANIYRSDINAVLMGSWITFKCRSSMNYALRSQDSSYVSEMATMGSSRSYYPKQRIGWKGENKMPDSYVFNDAYRTSVGFKCYYPLEDMNYIKDSFSNRILYSAVSILDSYKNNYRQSYSTYFRDYSLEYGSILKIIGFEGHLLVVLEHAIGLAPINERVLAGSGEGEPVFINTQNVLPEELTIISDTYGTLWPESVIKTESGSVYGVDTIAKKIWKVSGQQIEIISDLKVNKFLINNITLGERERYPIIGLKNVKTHYNNNKKDVMFTFYDDVYKGEEKVWNLCYNELMGLFVTFYSWVPSYSENIDTQFFSFDRTVSKELTLLDKCNYYNPKNSGVLLDLPILKNDNGEYKTTLHYVVEKVDSIKDIANNDYSISTEKCEINCNFVIEHDAAQNYKLFTYNLNTKELVVNDILELLSKLQEWDARTITLEVTPILSNMPESLANTGFSQYFKTETIALTLEEIVNNNGDNNNYPNMNTDFFLHGQAGIFDLSENLYPTHWYGKYHPFEFEFVVNDKAGMLKIFENLELISNKAEPESFHFEIEGDNYEFSNDKRAMYVRQELTKELFLNLGSNILFDRNYEEAMLYDYTHELYYRANEEDYTNQYVTRDRVYPIQLHGLVQQVKSTIFPLYYERVDTYNNIYHSYREMSGLNYDFKNLSGSEIIWDKKLNQFDIVTHIKNSPIDLVGRLRGNSRYKEGKWFILIPSIIFNLKNEGVWGTTESEFILNKSRLNSDSHLKITNRNSVSLSRPPMVINSGNIPNDLDTSVVSYDVLPNIYRNTQEGGFYNIVDTNGWTARKETKIRDKWIKIRVRYSGKNLAVIHSIITLYNISYS